MATPCICTNENGGCRSSTHTATRGSRARARPLALSRMVLNTSLPSLIKNHTGPPVAGRLSRCNRALRPGRRSSGTPQPLTGWTCCAPFESGLTGDALSALASRGPRRLFIRVHTMTALSSGGGGTAGVWNACGRRYRVPPGFVPCLDQCVLAAAVGQCAIEPAGDVKHQNVCAASLCVPGAPRPGGGVGERSDADLG